jgi:hypothetical protein
MKKYLAALLISLVPMLAAASGNVDDLYFSSNNPKLTPQGNRHSTGCRP